MAGPSRAHPHGPGPVYALVLECRRADGSRGDIWGGRKRLFVRLTCGHEVMRIGSRRFLVGERMRCKPCERDPQRVRQVPLFDLELTP